MNTLLHLPEKLSHRRLISTLWELLDDLLAKVYRSDDPSPECPVCRAAGVLEPGKMIRHDWRGVICDNCGSRVW